MLSLRALGKSRRYSNRWYVRARYGWHSDGGLWLQLAGAMRRMMNRLVSRAWEQWQAWYEDVLEQKVAGL